MSRGVGIFLSHNSVARRAGAWTVEDAGPYEDYYGGALGPSRTPVPTKIITAGRKKPPEGGSL